MYTYGLGNDINSIDEDFSVSEKTPILKTKSGETGRKYVGQKVYIYLLTPFVALGAFCYGYNTSVISGALLLLKTRFNLSQGWQELIVSVTIGFAVLGALSSGWFNEKYGRKPVLIVSSLIFTVGAIVMGVANSMEVLLIGRATAGVASGM